MQVGIVLVAFSGYPHRAFDSIAGKTSHQVTWFVHCHSADEALEQQLIGFCLRQKCDLRLHRHNRGLARSWNDGILASYESENDLTIVMHENIAFRPGAFDRFVAYLARTPPFGLAFLHGAEADPAHSDAARMPAFRQQDLACFAFGQVAFDEAGAFDENFVPESLEQADYMARARNLGLPVMIDPRVLVDHTLSPVPQQSHGESEAAAQANLAFYRAKWGAGPTGKPYDEAFGTRGNFIAWSDRHAPHGEGFDRSHLPPDWPPHLRLCSFPADAQAEPASTSVATPFPMPALLPAGPRIVAHVAGRGDIAADADGWAGLRGSSNAVEGFAIFLEGDIPPAALTYQAVLEDGTLTEAVEAGEFCGSRGESTPLFGLRIDIYDDFVDGLEVTYEAHFVDGSRAGPFLAPIVCRAQSGAALEAFRVIMTEEMENLEAYEV